jgi:hypothetical protein
MAGSSSRAEGRYVMRTALLATLALTSLLVGGTCLPIIQFQHQAAPGEALGIAVSASAQGETIPEGTPVTIDWAAATLTGESATVAITLESRTDLSRTVLASELTFAGTSSGAQALTWDTNGFGGPYSVIADITTPTLTREATSAGLVTIDARPKFEFTEPTGDVTFDPTTEPPLTIAWVGADESGTVSIGLDPDANHSNGNEILILQDGTLPTTLGPDSFAWDGTDATGAAVPAGTYNLFAKATDNVNQVVTVAGLGQITVVR